MLKRMICLLLVCFLFGSMAIAEIDFSFLNEYTLDDLEELYDQIAYRIALAKIGDEIYNENGVSITWHGIVKDGSKFKVGLVVSNNTGETIYFEISAIAFNGIKVGPGGNVAKAELNDGWADYTASSYSWLTELSILDELSIEHIANVKIEIKLYKDNGLFSHEFRTILIDFPVDIAVSDIE